MRFLVLTLSLLAALALASCGIDFQTKAVEKARDYALDNLKQLNETQRDFIRYTEPTIMNRVIYRMGDGKSDNSGDMLHLCMVWRVPGVDGSVVVAGHGERSLLEWSPDRILIEDMNAPDSVLAAANKEAVTFVMSRMLHLSDAERNRVRFTPPELFKTKFDVDPEDVKASEKPLSRWEAYLKSKEKKAQPVQYSFVWNAEEAGGKIVVCGYSPKEGVERWKAKEGMKIDAARLKEMELSENLAPAWPVKEAGEAKTGAESKRQGN
jgi:hypothetical protein